jgi:hypothetical protein
MNIDATETSLRRASLTISCRDAELIPKVANAGAVEMMGGKPVQIMHNGLKVMYGGYHGDWMATVIHGLRGHHEPKEERAFHEILRYWRPKTSIVELRRILGLLFHVVSEKHPVQSCLLPGAGCVSHRSRSREYAIERAGAHVHTRMHRGPIHF